MTATIGRYLHVDSMSTRSDRDPVLRFALDQREQERPRLVAGLADGGDVDGRVVLDGALVLADPAADALHGSMNGRLSSSVAPQRSVTSTLRVKIAFGLTGQTSSQTTQAVSIAQGRQRPWL